MRLMRMGLAPTLFGIVASRYCVLFETAAYWDR